MRYRLKVELAYLRALLATGLPKVPVLTEDILAALAAIEAGFTLDGARQIKEFERTTLHDIKALEYYLHLKLQDAGLEELVPWVHFALTSQDINNTAVPLQLKDYLEHVWQSALNTLISNMLAAAKSWAAMPMLARTHGQAASPTKLGKEIMVFVSRLQSQLATLVAMPHTGKFGGATGNFNAHYAAYPTHNWLQFADELLHSLGLGRQQHTTQIEHYDGLAARLQCIGRINTILTDFARDMWSYISLSYFTLPAKPGEVGSSAMPHKVNPIDFENAEGNLGLANALLGYMADKLPISRMQRDLTDSTVLRNLGVALCHSQLAIASLQRGFAKCVPNLPKLAQDLDDNVLVLAEAYQVIMRREGIADGYERMRAATRVGGTTAITLETLHALVRELPLPDTVKDELYALRPSTYVGKCPGY